MRIQFFLVKFIIEHRCVLVKSIKWVTFIFQHLSCYTVYDELFKNLPNLQLPNLYYWFINGLKLLLGIFAAYSINFAKNRLPHIEHAFIWNRLRGRWFVDNENRKFFEVLLFVSFPNLQILRRFYWGQQKFYHTELKRLFQGILVINSVTLLLQIRIHSATRNILLSPSWFFYVRKKHSS